MYNKIERSTAYQSQLMNHICHEYGKSPISITTAKRGYFGETWRLDTGNEQFFLKLDYTALHGPIYKNSFHVIEHLCNHGIDFISRIVKTKDGRLYSCFDSAVLGVFEWIDGENVQDERTKIPEYQMLARVYAVPSTNISIPQETFSTQSADLFYEQLNRLKNYSSAASIVALFGEYNDKITHRAERLVHFSNQCKSDVSDFYITHGDAGGNIITNRDRFYLVDWDDPILAPPERDAWFCLYWDWAMEAFNKALRQNGIDYALRPERLAYYCYHTFFWYLTEHLQTYFEIGNQGGNVCEKLVDYFNGWIEEELTFADTI